MRVDQLEHLIRAAADILGEDELIVVGSQSVLASTGDDDLPPEANRSIEADLLPLSDPEGRKADLIDGTIGEGSLFQEAHGICAQGVGVETSILPDGWRDRLVPLHNANTRGVTGWCLEPHDLVVSKLLAGRQKDLEFTRALLQVGFLDPALLVQRLALAPIDEARRTRAGALLSSLASP